MIPAKLGSTRLAMKNLALINGKPLIYYAIKAAKTSGAFDRIVVNAEDAIFSKIAERYDVDFYKRPDRIVKPTTKTDEVVYDFLRNNSCDAVAWVSPIAPLQTGEEVKCIANYFIKEDLDSLMTVKNEKVHCVYKDKPLNFGINEIFAQTQDLMPVQLFVYSTMMWRSKTFIKTFEKNKYALLSGKVGFYSVGKLSAIIIKRKEDLELAAQILRTMAKQRPRKILYDKVVDE
jgi:CMP-N-acetylneuraminic acid synthetase